MFFSLLHQPVKKLHPVRHNVGGSVHFRAVNEIRGDNGFEFVFFLFGEIPLGFCKHAIQIEIGWANDVFDGATGFTRCNAIKDVFVGDDATEIKLLAEFPASA